MDLTGRFAIVIVLTVTLLATSGCAATKSRAMASPTTHVEIQLAGTSGARITGYYIRDGQRVELDGVLPMSIAVPGVTQLAMRKMDPKDDLVVAARGPDGRQSTGSPPGDAQGIRLDLEGGGMSVIPGDESLSRPNNALIIIAPYWHEGTWVFDDPRVGLRQEPFVAGVPEMIDFLVKDIPSSRQGFRLTCSAQPFPGYQKKLLWIRAESGGNHYRLEEPPMEGWLCPAMFRYFAEAPRELYVRADPKNK